ncbi:nickel-dependent hydrogenase large subunit [Escherichia coli]
MGERTGNTLEVAQLHSTLGRIIGRTVHCCELQDILQNQYSALITNIGKGDHTTFVKPNIPATGELKVLASSKRRAVCSLTGW